VPTRRSARAEPTAAQHAHDESALTARFFLARSRCAPVHFALCARHVRAVMALRARTGRVTCPLQARCVPVRSALCSRCVDEIRGVPESLDVVLRYPIGEPLVAAEAYERCSLRLVAPRFRHRS
jgi:hypothetical protein